MNPTEKSDRLSLRDWIGLGAIVGGGGGGSYNVGTAGGTGGAGTAVVRIPGGAAGTTTFNGYGSARFLGGVYASTITITEVVP